MKLVEQGVVPMGNRQHTAARADRWSHRQSPLDAAALATTAGAEHHRQQGPADETSADSRYAAAGFRHDEKAFETSPGKVAAKCSRSRAARLDRFGTPSRLIAGTLASPPCIRHTPLCRRMGGAVSRKTRRRQKTAHGVCRILSRRPRYNPGRNSNVRSLYSGRVSWP